VYRSSTSTVQSNATTSTSKLAFRDLEINSVPDVCSLVAPPPLTSHFADSDLEQRLHHRPNPRQPLHPRRHRPTASCSQPFGNTPLLPALRSMGARYVLRRSTVGAIQRPSQFPETDTESRFIIIVCTLLIFMLVASLSSLSPPPLSKGSAPRTALSIMPFGTLGTPGPSHTPLAPLVFLASPALTSCILDHPTSS
jgi:hypothetical protein